MSVHVSPPKPFDTFLSNFVFEIYTKSCIVNLNLVSIHYNSYFESQISQKMAQCTSFVYTKHRPHYKFQLKYFSVKYKFNKIQVIIYDHVVYLQCD
jgi:hypothetical protein